MPSAEITLKGDPWQSQFNLLSYGEKVTGNVLDNGTRRPAILPLLERAIVRPSWSTIFNVDLSHESHRCSYIEHTGSRIVMVVMESDARSQVIYSRSVCDARTRTAISRFDP